MFHARLNGTDGASREIPVSCAEENGVQVFTLTPTEIGEGVANVDFLFDAFTAEAGDAGWFLYDAGTEGTYLTHFTPRDDMTFSRQMSFVGCYGMNRGEGGTLAIVTGGRCDFGMQMTVKGNRYALYPRFYTDGDLPTEDFRVEFYPLADATYSEMAQVYRNYMLTRGSCRPLAERIRENPVLAHSADGVAIRIRQGWKPVPPTIDFQTPENEPPLHVACTFDRACDVAQSLKDADVQNAEICLVGWNIGGHDGRFPQIFPPDPRLGGEERLKNLISYTQNLGYSIVCHDDATAAYTIADCFDEEYLLKNKDGSLHNRSRWGGGLPRKICPRRQYELFEMKNQPALRALGFRGIHYIDVLTILPLLKCYDPNHPTTRAESAEWYRKAMKLAQKTFGGMSSESGFDFAADALDFILYATFKTRWEPMIPCADERVPFWQIVYHGIVLYNPGTFTLNYPVKGERNRLHCIELGGRPLVCYYANFASNSHWMGIEDFYADTEENLKLSASNVRKMEEDYDLLKAERYCFITKHEQLSENVFRTVYDNGTTVTVDYGKETFEITRK